jgi:alkylation response protein AidB-like acyl-CoA dehydrogenase
MLQVALDTALDYASKRHAFGQAIADFQGLQWKLADVATDLQAARLLTYHAAEQLDAGAKASVPAAHAKKFASEVALSGVGQCMKVMGANGLKHDWPLARFFAQAKIAQSLDGTNEIQNVVIARDLLAPYRRRSA